MSNSRSSVSSIKKAQKESLLLREISQLFLQASLDDSRLNGIYINKIELSSDKSVCTVFFYTAAGKEAFDKIMPILILYKPSMRKALANNIKSRYAPELIFKFDDQFDKIMKLENLLEKVKNQDSQAGDKQ